MPTSGILEYAMWSSVLWEWNFQEAAVLWVIVILYSLKFSSFKWPVDAKAPWHIYLWARGAFFLTYDLKRPTHDCHGGRKNDLLATKSPGPPTGKSQQGVVSQTYTSVSTACSFALCPTLGSRQHFKGSQETGLIHPNPSLNWWVTGLATLRRRPNRGEMRYIWVRWRQWPNRKSARRRRLEGSLGGGQPGAGKGLKPWFPNPNPQTTPFPLAE
ncbi:hypothetical protein AAY473_011175 [Plecturocebus cupreus]